jgi:RimJ/RimL family protein N-acetyltransferase
MTTILETDRLTFREFEETDAAFILQLLNTPGWLKFIGDRHVYTLDDARHYLTDRLISGYAKFGFGFWMVELKPSGVPIGMCGLTRREGLEHADIGFALLPEYAGQGYGFEMASAALQFARQELGLDPILAITTPANKVSIHLLQKLGMEQVGTVRLPNDEVDLLLFRLSFENGLL